ncbi:MAG: fibronectin type III domain-containing protein [bacterium]
MKRTLFLKISILIVFILSGFGVLRSQNVYISEDFSSGVLSEEWSEEKDTTSSAQWSYTDGVAKFTGGNKFASSAAFITNAVDLSNSILPTFSFDYANSHSLGKVDTLVVYYRTADNLEWTQLYVGNKIQSTLTEVSFALTTAQQAEDFQLKFQAWNNFGGEITIDNIEIINALSCTTPPTSFRISALTDTSASFLWVPTSYADSTRVIVSTILSDNIEAADSTFLDDVMVASGGVVSGYTISSLELNELYYIYIQSNCGSGDVSEFISLSFQTQCSPLDVTDSYFEGFEDGTGCWTFQSTTGDYAILSSEYAFEGDSSLRFNTGESKYSYAMIPFDVDLATMELWFYAYTPASIGVDTTSIINVAILENPGDLSNMFDVQSIETTKTDAWQKFVVPLANYLEAGQYLVLYAGESESSNIIYIDNIELREATGCYEPLLPYAEDIRASSAKIFWTEFGTATSWNLRVSTTPLSKDALDASTTSDLISTNTMPFAVDGLEPQTTYYIYVQSGGCYWAYEPVVITTAGNIKVGDFFTFTESSISAIEPAWFYGNLVYSDELGDWEVWEYETIEGYTPLKIYSSENHTGLTNSDGGVLFYVLGSSSTHTPFVILPEIDVEEDLQDIQISLYLQQSVTGTPIVVSLCEGVDITTAVPIDTLYSTTAYAWENFIVSLEGYSGEGRNIAISTLFRNTSTSNTIFYVDDISIEKVERCSPISAMRIDETNSTDATISWSSVGAPIGSTWTIELYSSQKTDESEPVKTYTATSTSYVMDGLESAVGYYAYIRLNSDECPDAEWSSYLYFKTVLVTTIPYSNDFSLESTGCGNGPLNWYTYNPTQTSDSYNCYDPYVDSSSSYWTSLDGVCTTPYLRFSLSWNSAATVANYAVLPVLDADYDISNLTISFYAGYGGATGYVHNLAVGIMTDPDDPTTFVQVGTVSPALVEEQFRISTEGYTGSGRYIAFKSWVAPEDNAWGTICIDNLYIYECSDCEPGVSNIVATETDINTLSVSWTQGNAETSWNVKLFDSPVLSEEVDDMTTSLLTETTVTTTRATLTGLTHQNNFTYYIAIQSVGEDCIGAWVVTPHTTSCDYDYLDLKYSEMFDSYGTGEGTTPDCWYLKPNSANCGAEMNSMSGWPSTGLYLAGECAASESAGYSYAIMPMVESVKNTTISFYFTPQSSTSYVEIGVMRSVDATFKDQSVYYVDQPATDALFTSLYRLEPTEGKTYELVTYDFSSYTGTGNRIAFRIGGHLHTTTSEAVLIDMLTLSETADCSKMINITDEVVSQSSIKYSWGASDDNSWDIILATSEIDATTATTTDAEVVAYENVTSSSYTATSLTESTEYYFYVRRNNTEASCTGSWSDAVVASTLCPLVTVPFEDDFEDNDQTGIGSDVACWVLASENNVLPYIEVHSKDITGIDSSSDNTRCLAIVNPTFTTAGSTTIKSAYAISPELDVDAMSTVELSFDIYTPDSTGGQFEVGVVSNTSNYEYINNTFTSVYQDAVTVGEWTNIIVRFTSYTNDAFSGVGKRFAIMASPGVDSVGYVPNTIYIDNVKVEAYLPDCEVPFRLQTSNLAETTATLSWVAKETSEYQVIVTQSTDLDENTADQLNSVTTSPISLTGLSPNTIYYLAVRSKCDNGMYTDWSETVKVFTYGCTSGVVPYVEDFERYDDLYEDRIENCISFFAADEYAGTYYQLSSSSSTGNRMQMGSSVVTVLPEFSNLTSLQLQLDASISTSNYTFSVGVTRYISGANSFIALENLEFAATNQTETFTVDLSNYSSRIEDGDKLALQTATYKNEDDWSDAYNVYLDNIIVDYKFAFFAPEGAALVDPSYDAVTFVNTLSIVPEFMEIAFMTGNQTVDNTDLIYTVSDAPFDYNRITGLTPATQYRVAMRVSSSGQYSSWTDELSFSTFQMPAEVPYVCDFEAETQNADWRITSYNSSLEEVDNVEWIVNSATSYSTENSIYISNNGSDYGYSGSGINSLAMRSVEITEAGSYEFTVIAKSPTNTPSNYLTIALVPVEYSEFVSPNSLQNPITGAVYSLSSADEIYTLAKLYNEYPYNEWGSYSKVIDIATPGSYNVVLYNALGETPTAGTLPGAVDNIKVAKVDVLMPTDLTVSRIYSNEALATWTVSQDVDSCIVILTNTSNDDTERYTVVAPTTELQLTGLIAGVRYSVDVVAYMGGTPSVAKVAYFTTTPEAVTNIPYTYGFEDATENAMWTIDEQEADYTTNSWLIGADTYYDGAASLYINNGGGDSYAYSAGVTDSWSYRDFDITSPGIYSISMMVKCNTGDADDFMSVLFLPDWCEINFAEGEYTNINTGEVVDLSNTTFELNQYLIVNKIYNYSDWQEFSRDITITETGTYRFAVYFEADATQASGTPAAIDAINIDKVECGDPIDFTAIITNNSAALSWSTAENVASCDMIISDLDVDDVTTLEGANIIASETAITSNSYSVASLAASTTYYIYIRSTCTTEVLDYVQYQFTTYSTPLAVPYNQEFDLDINTLPEYWTVPNNDAVLSTEVNDPAISESDTTFNLSSGAYVVLPYFVPSVSALELSFDAVSSAASATVSVGVMLDPNNINTFVELASFSVAQYADRSNAISDRIYYAFDGYTGVGSSIAIKANAELFIDDVLVDYIGTHCDRVTELEVVNVYDKRAEISWNSTAATRVVLATVDAYDISALSDENIVSDETVLAGVSTYEFYALSHSTQYYVYIVSICEEAASSYVVKTNFTTLVGGVDIPYYEPFNISNLSEIYSEGWEVLEGSIELNTENFESETVLTLSSNSSIQLPTFDSDYMMNDLMFSIQILSSNKYATCEFYLGAIEEVGDISTFIPIDTITLPVRSDDDVYVMNDYVVNPSSYTGDSRSFVLRTTSYNVYIDNVFVNCAGERVIEDVIGIGNDYNRNGFNIFYTDILPGTNMYEQYVPSTENGVCDTTLYVNLTALDNVVVNIEGSICSDGSVYEENGFTESYQGLYLNRDMAVSGADSLTYLTLSLAEANPITETSLVICEGNEHNFGDLVITEAGVYYDTLVAANGCDSIIELTLSVMAAGQVNYAEDVMCEGSVYNFYGTPLTEAGTYTSDVLTTPDGCEYTVELTLSVLNVDTTEVEETITLEDLPYQYGDVIYDHNTPPGVYKEVFLSLNGTPCPDIVLYTLTIIEGDVAVDNTLILDLSMHPNPLAAGATLYVDAEFTAAERDGMVVEVMNMVGQSIIIERPTTEEIAINGLTQSGVYIVRITTGTGSQYLGKVIVK